MHNSIDTVTKVHHSIKTKKTLYTYTSQHDFYFFATTFFTTTFFLSVAELVASCNFSRLPL